MTHEDVIAVFPLPNVVFFPKTNLPLYIFEPRYCEMVRETMQNKQLIGIFLLQPGWQEDYYGNPPVYSIGCAGELIHVEDLPEGKFNIVLRGLYKTRTVEVMKEFPYRTARVEVIPETLKEENDKVTPLKNDLVADFQKIAKQFENFDPSAITKLTDFQEIINLIVVTLQFDVETKQQLLEENDLFVRAQYLRELVRKQVSFFDWTQRFGHLRPTDPNSN